jgi:hypothetical protein
MDALTAKMTHDQPPNASLGRMALKLGSSLASSPLLIASSFLLSHIAIVSSFLLFFPDFVLFALVSCAFYFSAFCCFIGFFAGKGCILIANHQGRDSIGAPLEIQLLRVRWWVIFSVIWWVSSHCNSPAGAGYIAHSPTSGHLTPRSL